MDRNGFGAKLVHSFLSSLSVRRAWIEIFTNPGSTTLTFPSLSVRRAWIEIPIVPVELTTLVVALRKESVDRNIICLSFFPKSIESLSVRRAWIEIEVTRNVHTGTYRRSP